ncbi:MAG: two-component regulator propeller domain-containing protein [Gemmatimonadaceae bacterium]
MPLPRSSRVTAVLLAGAMSLAIARAEAQTLQFRQLTPDDGLPSSQIDAIQQDSRGFMWFGSLRGLSRYDGQSFIAYRHRTGNAASLADNRVNALYEDHAATLWIGTNVGLSRYDAARDAFDNYRIGSPPALVVNTVFEIDGTLLVGTSAGLYAFDRATGKSSAYGGKTFAGLVIWRLFVDRAKRLWVGTETAGAIEFEPRSGASRAWMNDSANPASLPGRDVHGFHEDSSGAMWISSYDAGLARLDRASGVATRYSIDPRDPLLASSKRIRSMIAEGNRGLWLGTENGGLDFFDFATRGFVHHRFDPNNASGINNNSIWALYRDRSGILWAGTWAGGVNLSTQNGSAIKRYRSVAGDPRSLSFNSVIGFNEDSKGGIWVATDGGGLNRFDRATSTFARFNSHTSNLNSDAVLAVAEDHTGKLWIGTWAGALSRFDPRTGQFTAFTRANSGIETIGVFSLLVDRGGVLWIGTWHEGLQRYDPSDGSFARFPMVAPESPIHAIVEASDGNLLIATEGGGFVIFDPRTHRKTLYGAGKDGLSSNQVTSIVESEPGIVWIGTYGGLDRLDRRTNTFQHFTDADGLASTFVAGLALDDAHQLWVSSDRGITRFDPAARTGTHYTVGDGLQGSEFNAGSAFRSRDGTLYFGGTQGFSTLRPDSIVRNTHVPQIALTGFSLLNKPVVIGAKGSPLTASITVADAIVLQHDRSVFTIEFAALDFAAPEKNRYAYRLDGLDDDWNEVGTTRVASYTNLAAGSYLFKVRGSNNDGVWSDTPASIRIEVLPPFWSTWWFRALMALVVAAAGGALLRITHLRRAERARDAKQRAETESRQRLASEIRHFLDASGEGIVGLDASGCITFANRRASELLGYGPDELVGLSMHEATHHSTPDGSPYPANDCPIRRAAREGIACEIDDEVMWRKDGTTLQVAYAASPVRDEGQISGAVVNFRDITAKRRAELDLITARDAAQEASRAKSDFLARMSHELRTPLNSIIGFSNVLLRKRRLSFKEDEVTYLGRISASGRHLLGLINDILDLSKIEAGRMTIELSTVTLDTLVSETIDAFETQARERAVTLRAELPAELCSLETDAVRLKQVLINLLGNALKFTERGEVVVAIEADRDGRPLTLSVCDTGIGIPADRLAAIFSVFEQADSTTTRRFGGTGLGLAISRSLCELMGHGLEVKSTEGVGTTMTVSFGSPTSAWHRLTPLSSSIIPSYDTALDSEAPSVLVVDDESDARLLLGHLLDDAGCKVLYAAGGVEALRMARALRPAMVFLDLAMPSISGLDLFRLLRADDVLKDTPIVIVSVNGNDSRSSLEGAAAILDKPITREQVNDLVKLWLPAFGNPVAAH